MNFFKIVILFQTCCDFGSKTSQSRFTWYASISDCLYHCVYVCVTCRIIVDLLHMNVAPVAIERMLRTMASPSSSRRLSVPASSAVSQTSLATSYSVSSISSYATPPVACEETPSTSWLLYSWHTVNFCLILIASVNKLICCSLSILSAIFQVNLG